MRDVLSTRAGRAVSILLLTAATAWFSLPAFGIAYTEGFQAEIVLVGHALRQGDIGLADTLFPFDGRFFVLTRLGTALCIQGLKEMGVPTGLDAFRILGVASVLVMVGALLLLLRRQGIGPRLGLLACLLFPPIFESAGLPNDDLPSAALVCLAVLCFWSRPTILRTAVAGVLLGVAALLRLDAVLVAPAFAILLVTEVPGWGARAVRAAIAGVLVIGIPMLTYWLCGLSFLDSFAAVDRGLALWGRPSQALYNDLRTVVLSITAAGGIAWLLGIAAFVRARRWRDLALALAVPVLYAAAYRSQLVEGRYLLPLSPFLLPAMAEGLRSAAVLPRPWATAALTAGFLAWLVPAPPGAWRGPQITDEDGPRLLLGRFWNPLPTLWWQDRLRAGQAALASAIEQAATAPAPVVVTGAWTSDRLVPLMLIEHGFAIQAASAAPACRTVGETYVRGSVALLHIRTHTPFVPHQNEAVTWEQAGLPCLASGGPDRPVLFVGSGRFTSPTVMLDGPGLLFSGAHDRPPALAPYVVGGLSGLSVAWLRPSAVADALGGLPVTEVRQAATDTLAKRAELFR